MARAGLTCLPAPRPRQADIVEVTLDSHLLARAAGDYLEREVRPSLRDHFSCVWVNRLSPASPSPIVVVPDGAIDLQWIAGRWRIAGPDSEAQVEDVEPGSVVIGFRFQPGSAQAWLGVEASELRNRRIALEEVCPTRGRQMDSAAEAVRSHDPIQDLESVVARWAPSQSPPDPRMKAVHRLVSAGAPPGTDLVPWLMAELSLSERTLRRRCEAALGYGPKTLDRILRFQRFLGSARSRAGESAAHHAAAVGYADQPHLVRECRRLALCTPGQIG